MKQASVRQLQHCLSDIIRWVDHGEEVKITRRNRVIARLVPDSERRVNVTMPDFAKRARKILPHAGGKPLSEIVFEDRKSRF